MQEAVINFCRIAYASQLLWDKPAPRVGNRSVLGTNAPSEAYACKGGGPNDYCYIYTTRAGNHHWERLLQVIGREDLLDDPRFADNERPLASTATRSTRCIGAWIAQRDKREVMETLGHAGVPAGAVFDTERADQRPVPARARHVRHCQPPGPRRGHDPGLAGQDVGLAGAA